MSGDPRPGPRGLPDLQALLLRQWQPGAAFAESATAHRTLHVAEEDRWERSHEVALRGPGYWERDALEDAQLWWVSEEMTDLLDAAAPTIPGVALTAEVMPNLYGLVRFAHPLRGLDAERNALLTVDAMQWGPITLPPRRGSRQGTPGIGIASYRRVTADMLRAELDAEGPSGVADFGLDREWREADDTGKRRILSSNGIDLADHGPMWVPLGRADWCVGDEPDDRAFEMTVQDGQDTGPVDEQTHLSMVEDRRRMLALWVLSAQPGVATHHVDRGDRADRRRAARAGLPLPDVQVVHLRRLKPPDGTPDGEGVAWSHRWIVSGHWRQQAVGEGRRLRRPTWIAPHVKGPEGKPLAEPTKVRSWTR